MQFVKSINSFKDLAIDEFGNAWFLKYLRNRSDIQLTYITLHAVVSYKWIWLLCVQMPRGVPVATVAINNATNAGLLAVRMLGVADDNLLSRFAPLILY
jgi:hypothetical protein